jgi:NAD/NADP transhydrogenase beta subunit
MAQRPMHKHQLIELSVSTFTLCLSFWVAFGPLRHRLPRFITRFAKYSAAFKLAALSALCWWALHMNIQAHGSYPIRWMLVMLGVSLLAGAGFVLTRKTMASPVAAPKAIAPTHGDAA